MYVEVNSALQGLNVIKNWLSANKRLSNYNELVTAVSEVSSKLMEANSIALASQEKQALLTNRIRELENEIAEFKKWEQEIDRYKHFQFPSGALAYALSSSMDTKNPMHYFCSQGVSKRERHELQPSNNGITLDCHICKIRIETEQITGAKRRNLVKPSWHT